MKITTQTFDLFELTISIVHQLYSLFFGDKEEEKLSQQELLDYDFVVGQVAKIVLFLMQIIYYLDMNKLDPLQTSILIQGYYVFAVFIVLVEQKYIYRGYSYTFHRIIAYRFMNIFVNFVSLLVIHQDSSLLYTWENIKNFDIGIAEALLIGLVFFTGMETLQLLFQLCTSVFSCMNRFNNTQEYDSQGGCGYLCIGQFIGIVIMGGSMLLLFYQKKTPFSSLFTLQVIVTEGLVGLEFIISCILYCKSGKVQNDPPRSKKVLCFGYGFVIGAMGIIAGPAIIGVVLTYGFYRTLCCCHQFKWRCIICCWCAKEDRSHHYQQSNIPIQTRED